MEIGRGQEHAVLCKANVTEIALKQSVGSHMVPIKCSLVIGKEMP